MKKYFNMLFAVLVLAFVPKIAFAKNVVAYGQCSYDVEFGKEKSNGKSVYETYVDNNIIEFDNYDFTFVFSESLLRNGYARSLFVGSTFNSNTWDIVSEKGKNQFSGKNFGNTGEDLAKSLYNALNTNNGACPNYLLFVNSGGKMYSEFSNSDKKCDSENCALIAKVSGKGDIVSLPINEFYWRASTVDNNKIYIRLDENGHLRSSICTGNANPFKTRVSGGGGRGTSGDCKDVTALKVLTTDSPQEHLKSLVSSNYVKRIAVINGNDVQLGGDKPDTNSCANYVVGQGCVSSKTNNLFYESLSFEKNYLCEQFSDVKAQLSSFTDTIWQRWQLYSTKKNKLKDIFEFDGNRVVGVKDFTLDTKEVLNNKLDLLKTNTIVDDKFEKDSLEYIRLLKLYAENKDGSYCSSIGSEVQKYDETNGYSKKVEDLQVYIEFVKKATSEISRIAGEKGFKDVKEKSDQLGAEADESLEKINNISYKLREGYISLLDPESAMFDFSGGYKTGCEAIASLNNLLQTILNYIRIIGIALAVIFQVLDYIKVIFGSGDDSMVKANKHLSVRIIAVALLFLAPALITFVLQFFNLNGTGIAGTCNIK